MSKPGNRVVFSNVRANVKDLEKKDGPISASKMSAERSTRYFFLPFFPPSKNNIMEMQVRRCLR